MYANFLVLLLITISIDASLPLQPSGAAAPEGEATVPLPCICIEDCKIGYHCGRQAHCTNPESCRYCTCVPIVPCAAKD